jgi:hypothetical protein
MPRQPAPPVAQPHTIGHSGGPFLDLTPPPSCSPLGHWGRLPEFCRHYRCKSTTAYAWLATGRVHSAKIGGLRLWEIGTVRGVDNNEQPEPSWAVPAAARPENEGRSYGHRHKTATEPAQRVTASAGVHHSSLPYEAA